jgi:hypothetical protein
VGGEEAMLLPVVEEMDQEHVKLNAQWWIRGKAINKKDHDMIMNKKNEGEKRNCNMITSRSQQTWTLHLVLLKREWTTHKKDGIETNNIKKITPSTI